MLDNQGNLNRVEAIIGNLNASYQHNNHNCNKDIGQGRMQIFFLMGFGLKKNGGNIKMIIYPLLKSQKIILSVDF